MKTVQKLIIIMVFFAISWVHFPFNPPEVQAGPLYLPLIIRALFEGFEGGVVPPSGWTLIQNNPRQTWKVVQDTTYSYQGNYFADVEYDDQLAQQNEILLSPNFKTGSASLEFYSFGSLYWCRDDNDNCDLNVWLVVGDWDGGTGDDVFVRKADQDWVEDPDNPGYSTWSKTSIDLTASLQTLPQGTTVRIGFQYTGLDGAEVGLDNIRLQ